MVNSLLYLEKGLLCLLVCSMPALATYSQSYENYFFKRYASPDELPSQSCSSVYKDTYGFLWVGNAYGVSIFNGREFANLSGYSNNKDFYLGDSPHKFLQIDNERLLITCTNGLFLFFYQTRNVERLNIDLKKSPEEKIEILGFNKSKDRVVIKAQGIVYLFDKNFKLQHSYTLTDIRNEVSVRNENTSPSCFYYSNKGYLARLDVETGKIDSVLKLNSPKGLVINGQDADKYLVVTSQKIIPLDKQTFTAGLATEVPKQEPGYFFFPRTTKKDSQGNFWIGGENILFVYNPVTKIVTLLNGRISNFSSKTLNAFSIYDLWIDSESIFAASYRGGLFEYKKELNKFSDYYLPENRNAITYSMVVYKNTILGANDLKGLYQFALNKNEPAYKFHPVSNNSGSLLQIEKLDDENIWALFDEAFKIGIIDLETLTLKPDTLAINTTIRRYFDSISNFRLLNRDFRPIIKNINKELSYISLGRSLYAIVGNTKAGFKFNLIDTVVSGGAISSISSGSKLIVGTTKGELFAREDNKLIKKVTALNNVFLPVKSIDNDKLGNIYSMTAYGLYIYNNNFLFKKGLTKSVSGMIDNKIFSGKIDSNGILWMATYGGLMSYNTITDQLTNYPSTGLMRNVMFVTKAMAFDEDKIFFGGTEGITQINTSTLPADPIRSTLYFDEISNGTKQLHFGLVPGSIVERRPFSYNKNSLSLSFKSISYQLTEGTFYKYKLEGFDSTWKVIDRGKSLNFLSLEPGDYNLVIKEIYPNNVPGGQINYTFSIEKPFWKTLAFSTLATLLLCALFAFVIAFIFRKKMERQRIKAFRQIALKNERERISQDLHDDLGSGLTSIRLLSKAVLAKQDAGKGNTMLDSIGKISGELIDQMSEIIWVLNHVDDTLNGLLSHLRMYMAEYLQRTEQSLKLEIVNNCAVENNITGIQRRNILLVSKEVFHNVVKHSFATIFSVDCKCNEKYIIIKMRDNGVGLPDKINARGNGLNNIKKRIAAINGTVKIESSEGTLITIEIPKEKTV